jgi:hypothetical protein
VILCLVAPTLLAQTTSPPAPLQSQDKLSVRLKAKLPDYKGPSQFIGRKALIPSSRDGRFKEATLDPWALPTAIDFVRFADVEPEH